MERYKETHLLFPLILSLMCVCANTQEDPPKLPENLTCFTDFNRTVTCVLKSPNVSGRPDHVCTVLMKKEKGFQFNSSCVLAPVDVSSPELQTCTLIFNRDETFLSFYEMSIYLSCNHGEQRLIVSNWKPSSHIKLTPPGKPEVNLTTVSWVAQSAKRQRINVYEFQLQYRQKGQPWNEQQVKALHCAWECAAELDRDLLVQGESYEARVRVKPDQYWAESTWSDWGPTATWKSLVGKPPTDGPGGILGIAAGATVFAAFMVAILLMINKTTLVHIVYMGKRMIDPDVPTPEKSFLKNADFQSWLSPYLTKESTNSFLKSGEFAPVELTSCVDAIAPFGPESAALLEKIRGSNGSYNDSSSGSDFSNPIYPVMCPPPPVSLPLPLPVSTLTPGNLGPCFVDTPYGPVCSQAEKSEKNSQPDRQGEAADILILPLLTKESNNADIPKMAVISEYEKVEKLQVERLRLQSLDSGVCSGEEISQEESLDVSVDEGSNDGLEATRETDSERGEKVDFNKLFGGSGGVFGKGSIQVCSGYERVPKTNADSSELPSLDSGTSSGGEERISQEESVEEDIDKSTQFTSVLFTPSPISSILPCSDLSEFTKLPLDFIGTGLVSGLQLETSHMYEGIGVLSTCRAVEPSSDGYMPVQQEQC